MANTFKRETIEGDDKLFVWTGDYWQEIPDVVAIEDERAVMFTGLANITVGTIAPSSPAVNDLFVDTT